MTDATDLPEAPIYRETPPPKRNPPPDLWTVRRRRTYSPSQIGLAVLGLFALVLILGGALAILVPALLGGYNSCPAVSNVQAFQQVEDFALVRFPARFQLAGNNFGVEYDLRARNECDIYVRFDLEPSQLDAMVASTLIGDVDQLAEGERPVAFERAAWHSDEIGGLARFLGGEARSELYAAARVQSLIVDITNPTRYVVYLVVNVLPLES